MLVDTIGGGLLNPFELVYAVKVASISLVQAGIALSAAAALGIALGPAAGVASDRMGPRNTVAAANASGVAGCAVLLLWRGPLGFALGTFLLGANMRIFWAAFVPLVTSLARAHELESWFGRIRGVRYIGILLGQALSSLVLLADLRTGLRVLVLADGISFVVALVLLLCAAPGVPDRSHAHPPAPGGYRDVLSDRVNLALAAANVPATLMLTAPVVILPVYILDHLDLPTWLPGLAAAVLTATASIGLLTVARLVSGRRRLRSLQLAALLWALGCAVFVLAKAGGIAVRYLVLLTGVVLLGAGEAVYAPTADALPAALAPPGLRGRYAALHQMAWGISDSIAPVLAAALLDAGDVVLWLALASIAVVTGVTYRMLESPTRGRDGTSGEAFAGHS